MAQSRTEFSAQLDVPLGAFDVPLAGEVVASPGGHRGEPDHGEGNND